MMKDAYIQKPKGRLDEWGADIDKLKAKADQADAEAQLNYYKQIEELPGQQESARDRLTELAEASDDTWEDMKTGFESAWTEMEDALKTAAGRFG